jgi:hypothetical protein
VWYAAFKTPREPVPDDCRDQRAHAADLEGYATSKGTVRFPSQVPAGGVAKRLVKTRVAELDKPRGGSHEKNLGLVLVGCGSLSTA